MWWGSVPGSSWIETKKYETIRESNNETEQKKKQRTSFQRALTKRIDFAQLECTADDTTFGVQTRSTETQADEHVFMTGTTDADTSLGVEVFR